MPADASVTYDVVRQLQIAADGKTCTLRLIDGTTLVGTVVADTNALVLRINVSGTIWVVPTGNITALTAS